MSTSNPFYDWSDDEGVELEPGHRVQVVTGQGLQAIRSVIAPGSEFALHEHPHEQIIFVLAGAFEFTIGETTKVVGPGGAFHLAPGVRHGGRAVGSEPLVLVEAFAPPRLDYVEPSAAPDHLNPR